MTKKPLTISVLARYAGVGVETVRYYQRIGLIVKPEKPTAGYRIYPRETLARLDVIRRAKGLGFSLREIAALIDLGGERCADARRIAGHKVRLIEGKIEELAQMKSALEKLIACCDSQAADDACPIISELLAVDAPAVLDQSSNAADHA